MRRICRLSIGVVAFAVAPVRGQETSDLGFEAGALGQRPAGWFVPTDGWSAELSHERAAQGSTSAKRNLTAASTEPSGDLMRSLNAAPYRGRHVTLRAKVFVQGEGRSQMWLRVDRENGRMGAFDNMADRPILPGEWKDALIEADVEYDAKALNLGFMALDAATVFIDAVSLTTWPDPNSKPQPATPARAPSPRELENLVAAARLLSYVRFFHPSDQAVGIVDWDRFAMDFLERAEPAADSAGLVRRLSDALAPIAPTVQLWAGPPEPGPPTPTAPAGATEVLSWRHYGAGRIGPGTHPLYRSEIERDPVASSDDRSGPARMHAVKSLGAGVSCRLPIQVFADAGGTLPHGRTPEEWSKKDGTPKLTALNRSTRLAGVALAWGVLEHFYPYFDVVETSWDAVLPEAMKKAAADTDERAYVRTLWALTARLHDGHANVSNPELWNAKYLPLALQWAGTELVVVGTHAVAAETVKRGDVVVAIDGQSADECYRRVSEWISAATDGWRRVQSIFRLMIDLPTANPVAFTLRRPDGSTYSVTLPRVSEWPDIAAPNRPRNGGAVAPGIVYFNLDRAGAAELDGVMNRLERAQGVVFDLRGYPGDAGVELILHLIDGPAASPRWMVPIARRPDREDVEWSPADRWSLVPKPPRLSAKIAFLTEGSAISYAESIMGIVEHYRLGEVVGSTTAGTNGDVNMFTVAGGFLVSFSGMRVLKHDGSRHHGVGVAPTVPVVPTPAGIAAGRDEVLERAVQVLQRRIGDDRPAP